MYNWKKVETGLFQIYWSRKKIAREIEGPASCPMEGNWGQVLIGLRHNGPMVFEARCGRKYIKRTIECKA